MISQKLKHDTFPFWPNHRHNLSSIYLRERESGFMKKNKVQKKRHKHFWLPKGGYKNPDEGEWAGRWGVETVYCAYCLKEKEL